ncbi:hypothetical protein P4N68_08285 [Corynebacterium felinum]|uniref:PQQ enzyme repeat protein n=2 Tax=Corynebacterium felinum TaxID=131318 RepID=A0ABU2B9J7_9CORY|nr:hypothetical protein [Corynebacterium felinum]MDF5821076.1 hypothetical protein [Corynebacterium felinum]MDR7354941.1 hypothetical protein [Corynebacterium felinum]WJY94299.1 hypothetical protein CFELI_03285 [Corynebacterium felinum]
MNSHARIPTLIHGKNHRVVAVIIAVICVVCIAGAWWTAPIRLSALSPAQSPFLEPLPATRVSEGYEEAMRVAFDVDVPAPVIVGGLLISVSNGAETLVGADDTQHRHDGSTVSAFDPATGDKVWEYRRELDVCSLAHGWGEVIISYRSGLGCGEVVSIDALTGNYSSTRSSIAPPVVAPVASNDRVGVVASTRVELWRNDLVRTVEFGRVEAKQEPEMQPYEECEINSALTRTDVLAVAHKCEDIGYLRVIGTTPEDSRKPELTFEAPLPSPHAQVVGVTSSAVAVYVPGDHPSLMLFDAEGTLRSTSTVAASPAVDQANGVYSPAVADLPHHITWFDGARLYVLHPTQLDILFTFDDAIGTPINVGSSLVYPTASGINVADWTTGEVVSSLPLDRGDFSGTTALKSSGKNLVEKQGHELVVYRPRA